MAEEKKAAKARVLVATGDHQVNDILSGADAEAAIEAGWADGAASAVSYAERQARRRRERAEADEE